MIGSHVKQFTLMPTNTLTMIRGGIPQQYPIKRATWGFSKPAPYLIPVLSLAIETETLASIFPDDDNWPHDPTWSLDVWCRNLSEGMLVPGSEFAIAGCYDDFTGVVYTAFFYDEHEGTGNNLIKIIAREGDSLALSIEGEISDLHASMTPTRIVVDARFSKLSPHGEIDAQFYRGALPPHEPPYGAMYSPPRPVA